MRRVLATVAVGGLLAGVLVPAAQVEARVTPAPVRVLPAGHRWAVTLITGDVVQVSTDPAGRQRVTPDARRAPVRVVTQPNGHVFVLPATVGSLVGRILDPALFDVTELIKQGDDDAHSKSIPLIVQGPAGAPLTAGMKKGQTLRTLGAVAATMPKTRPIGAQLRAMAAHHGTITPKVTGGVRHIWLDLKVKATATSSPTTPSASKAAKAAPPTAPKKGVLDGNLNQIHAPQAWQAGVTGKGVTVAVLDTGIDATHPDLRGKVVAAKDFSGSGSTVDHFGHGTHVAATIAGTGSASGGARKGVAYGARLLIGKVLGDDGEGDESAVIAGMDWAAPQAKIINMSLGSDGASDGTDPLSVEVDTLSRQDHTLFVIAAGNDGPTAGTVSSPAAAGSALAVGAVDDKNRLADFSSRGPLIGSNAIKPELDAPGVNIVEARAAGTTLGTPIDADYTMASGTSMATPHVAGVAALVAQRHPDWTGDQIKAALIASAQPVVTGGDTYERGAGLVDAATAIGQLTGEQGVLNLGTFAYPQPAGHATTKSVVWRNTGTKPVTLKLSATAGLRTAKAASSAAAKISPSQVTIPAQGTASATLTIDPHAFAAKPGLYAGTVTASGTSGSVRTPFGFYEEPESHNLTIKVTPVPGGTSTDSAVFVNDLDDVALFSQEVDLTGSGTVRVPAGRYSVTGGVADFIGNNFIYAIGGNPYVDLHHDATVTIDAAKAKPLTASVTGQATEKESVYGGYYQSFGHGTGHSDSVWGAYPSADTAYVQPMSAPKGSGFTAVDGIRLESPVVTAGLPTGPLATLFGTNSPYVPEGARTVPTVYAGSGATMPDTKAKVAVVDYDPNGEDPATIVQRAKDAGATLVAFASTAAGTPVVAPAGRGESFGIPVLGFGGNDGARLIAAAKAAGSITLTGHPASAFDYDLTIPLGGDLTGAPYVVTPAVKKKLATVQDHFDAIGLKVELTRYTPPIPGDYVEGEFENSRPVPSVQTTYLTPGIAYNDVADIPVGNGLIGFLASPQTYTSGSVHSVTWNRRPFFPGPYDGGDTGSECQPTPVTRTQGNLRVWLAEFRDATDRLDCLGFGDTPERSSLRLTRDGVAVGAPVSGEPAADFPIPAGAATYKLSYDQVTTAPVATDTSTTWTFRSTGPGGSTVAQVPLLEVGYALPLGPNNRPAGDQATFTVNRVHGAPAAKVTSLAVQTSVDGGKTWTTAAVRSLGGGRFTVTMPKAAGKWVSLRSDAKDAGGSRIQQTLINAYQG